MGESMEKKYQIFISSTYEDLKEERRKVQDTILSMYQFPIGMEMFSAADEDLITIYPNPTWPIFIPTQKYEEIR